MESNNVKDGQINHNAEIFINDEFYEELKEIFKSKSENYSTQIDLLMQKYKEILYSEFKDLDKNLLGTYPSLKLSACTLYQPF